MSGQCVLGDLGACAGNALLLECLVMRKINLTAIGEEIDEKQKKCYHCSQRSVGKEWIDENRK